MKNKNKQKYWFNFEYELSYTDKTRKTFRCLAVNGRSARKKLLQEVVKLVSVTREDIPISIKNENGHEE